VVDVVVVDGVPAVEPDAGLVGVGAVVVRWRGLTWTVSQTRRCARRWQTRRGLPVDASPRLAVATSPSVSATATTSAARDLK